MLVGRGAGQQIVRCEARDGFGVARLQRAIRACTVATRRAETSAPPRVPLADGGTHAEASSGAAASPPRHRRVHTGEQGSTIGNGIGEKRSRAPSLRYRAAAASDERVACSLDTRRVDARRLIVVGGGFARPAGDPSHAAHAPCPPTCAAHELRRQLEERHLRAIGEQFRESDIVIVSSGR